MPPLKKGVTNGRRSIGVETHTGHMPALSFAPKNECAVTAATRIASEKGELCRKNISERTGSGAKRV